MPLAVWPALAAVAWPPGRRLPTGCGLSICSSGLAVVRWTTTALAWLVVLACVAIAAVGALAVLGTGCVPGAFAACSRVPGAGGGFALCAGRWCCAAGPVGPALAGLAPTTALATVASVCAAAATPRILALPVAGRLLGWLFLAEFFRNVLRTRFAEVHIEAAAVVEAEGGVHGGVPQDRFQ